MNINKIDSYLVFITTTANDEKKFKCLISTNRFNQLKSILLHRKIEILNEYLFIKSFYIYATKSDIEFLSLQNNVKFICSNSCAMALMYIAKKVLKLPETSLTGEGIGVAFIDTGIANHYDFCLGQNRIKKFIDFVNDKKTVYDDNGHGTFIAGVCSGSGAVSAGKYKGFAPKSNIYALKALDKNGEAYSNKILSAMEWVFDNHKKNNIRVVCMSFGSEPLGYNDPIMNGAEALWKEGVIVVAAAGNSGPEFQSIKSPGVSRRIITVGGMDDNRLDDRSFSPEFYEIANFSSRGPSFKSFKPDIVAPAVDITSCGSGGDYVKLSGTSVATPMIAGAMTLFCEKYKNISPDEAKRKLLLSCQPISFNKNMEGFGYPNLTKLFN